MTVAVLTFAVLELTAHILQDSPKYKLIYNRFLPANPFWRFVKLMVFRACSREIHVKTLEKTFPFTSFFPFLI